MNTAMGIRNIALAAAAAITASAGLAMAETATGPTDGATSRPQVTSPYWTQDHADAAPVVAAQYSGPRNADELMATTVLAVPQAAADATVAKWTYRRINNQLNVSSNQMRSDFRESDEYARAVNELHDAYAALEAARGEATKNLAATPEYQAATSLRKSVSEQIADEREQDKPSLEKLAALASLKIDYVTPVRAAERDSLAQSSAVREAKDRLVKAAREVARLEKDFARDVRDSIELADIRKSKESARIAMLASSEYLDEARLARAIAVRYAYVMHGLDQPYGNAFVGGYGYSGYGNYYTPSCGYGYGGGYGYGPVAFGGTAGSFASGNSPFGAGTNAFVGHAPGRNDVAPGTRNVGRPGNNEFNPFGSGQTSFNPFGQSPARYNPFGKSGSFYNAGNSGNAPSNGR